MVHTMTSDVMKPDYAAVPDADGRFGIFGGKFVAETLMSALSDLEELYRRLSQDPEFQRELDMDLAYYVGRPSPLYEASRWSDNVGGARIYLKREDLNHTGAHKVNNCIGQALLARSRWASRESSPRPAPASTASLPLPSPPAWVSSARYSWARKTCAGRHSMCTA